MRGAYLPLARLNMFRSGMLRASKRSDSSSHFLKTNMFAVARVLGIASFFGSVRTSLGNFLIFLSLPFSSHFPPNTIASASSISIRVFQFFDCDLSISQMHWLVHCLPVDKCRGVNRLDMGY